MCAPSAGELIYAWNSNWIWIGQGSVVRMQEDPGSEPEKPGPGFLSWLAVKPWEVTLPTELLSVKLEKTAKSHHEY